MSTPVRQDPPHAGTEHETLEAFLDYHRATLLWKVDGVRDEELRRPMTPSGVTLLGIVKHLAYVERWWSRCTFAGDTPDPWTPEDPDFEWRIELEETTEEVLALYRDEVALCREISRAASLNDIARKPGSDFSLRWIMVHMIEETARHRGDCPAQRPCRHPARDNRRRHRGVTDADWPGRQERHPDQTRIELSGSELIRRSVWHIEEPEEKQQCEDGPDKVETNHWDALLSGCYGLLHRLPAVYSHVVNVPEIEQSQL